MSSKVVACILGVSLGVAGFSQTPAQASSTSTAEAIATQIGTVAVTPTGVAQIPVKIESAQIVAKSGSIVIAIPTTDAGKVSLSRPYASAQFLRVGLPRGAGTQIFAAASDGTVTYQQGLAGVDVAVQAFDQGVRIQTVIGDARAPRSFAYPVDVPTGGRLELTPTGGVLVLDAEGLPRGGFGLPWAKDAAGTSVPTHYAISGNVVTQIVQHTQSHRFPVVADPWLWIDLISSAQWAYDPAHGFTLKVTPSTWQRINNGYLPAVAGWNELYDKYRDRGLNANLAGMRNQYICHVQIVSIRDPGKPTWNLDEWRPDVGYPSTVNQYCNPGAGRSIFD